MTREEQIKNAAINIYNYNEFIERNEYFAFIDGSKWADNNPNISSLWHDTNEEPKENTDILYISNGKLYTISKIDNKLYWCINYEDGIDKWAYINDLLPKE